MHIKFQLDSKSTLDYHNDSFKVHHVRPNDASCDLLLLVSNETEKILIPCDKLILMKNIPFFEAMFSDSSNWVESKLINNERQRRRNCKRKKEYTFTIGIEELFERVDSSELFDEKEKQIKLFTSKSTSKTTVSTVKLSFDSPAVFGNFLRAHLSKGFFN